MLDFFDLVTNPSYDIKYYEGGKGTGLFVWTKPRGAKLIYFMAVGAGASGGCGINTTTTSGGGAGGGGGGTSIALIPAMFVPEVVYITCAAGAVGNNVSGAFGVNGQATQIGIENIGAEAASTTILFAKGGVAAATTANSTTGGVGGLGGGATTLISTGLAAKGFNSFLSGGNGGNGGTSTTVGSNITYPLTGVWTSGGAGGGGCDGTTGYAGGGATAYSQLPLGNEFNFPNISSVAAGASGSTPAGNGLLGFKSRFLPNGGGFGGGGASGTTGGNAGKGGEGAPGCGGGGSGGCTTTNGTVPISGAGGPGFALIISM